MKPLLKKTIVDAIYYLKRRRGVVKPQFSRYEIAKEFTKLKVIVKQAIASYFLLAIGILAAGFGLRGFLLPNHFI
ncbi:MAG: hypothetical protein ACHQFW_12225, partial [Chitinophagales bacterium]